MKKKYMGALTAGILLCAAAFYAPLYAPQTVALGDTFLPPSAAHLLGTDHLGRDLWSILVYGLFRTLIALAAGGATALGMGLCLGLLAGCGGAALRAAVMGFVDLTMIVPPFMGALIVTALWGLTPLAAGITLGFFGMGVYANQTAFLTQRLQDEDFVKNEMRLGFPARQVMVRHILPHVLPSVLTLFGSRVSAVILQYAGLTFIGAGADMSMPDWGMALYQYRFYMADEPRLILCPLAAISGLVLLVHRTAEYLSERKLRRL